jgi:hypothetical protein
VDPDEQVDLEMKEIPGSPLFFSLGQQATVLSGKAEFSFAEFLHS